MLRARDIVKGSRFGILTAIEIVRTEKRSHLFVRCYCDCGSIPDGKMIRSDHLLQGRVSSCGCKISREGRYRDGVRTIGEASLHNGRPIFPETLFDRYIPVPESGCWLWDGPTTNLGYGSVKFLVHGRRVYVLAHREFYRRFNGEIPEGLLVCHKCDTPTCVNPSHLFLGTNKDNVQDAKRKGRLRGGEGHPPGEDHPHSLFSDSRLIEISTMPGSANEIAKRLGIRKHHVVSARYFARTGFRTWKKGRHLESTP